MKHNKKYFWKTCNLIESKKYKVCFCKGPLQQSNDTVNNTNTVYMSIRVQEIDIHEIPGKNLIHFLELLNRKTKNKNRSTQLFQNCRVLEFYNIRMYISLDCVCVCGGEDFAFFLYSIKIKRNFIKINIFLLCFMLTMTWLHV